jgi:acetoin utilization protein AcuB
MFCGQLISSEIVPMTLQDKVGNASLLMEELRISQLPVVVDETYLGLVSEEDLLDEADETPLEKLQDYFLKPAVKINDHFLVAVKFSRLFHLDIVPVLDEKNELEGVLTTESLFRELSNFVGAGEPGSIVVLEMERKDFSLGELNRLVESNDAYITQLNTQVDPASQLITVVLKINKEEISDIIATFQRHEFNVRYYLGEELFKNELQENLDHLMNYLNM